MSSWKINPSTGDYVMENGKPVPSDSLTIPAYYRIKIPRGGWLYAPNDKYGSDLNTLKKKAGNASITMMQQALEPMIDDGRALAVDVDPAGVQPTSRNGQSLNVVITGADGTAQILNLPPVGD